MMFIDFVKIINIFLAAVVEDENAYLYILSDTVNCYDHTTIYTCLIKLKDHSIKGLIYKHILLFPIIWGNICNS